MSRRPFSGEGGCRGPPSPSPTATAVSHSFIFGRLMVARLMVAVFEDVISRVGYVLGKKKSGNEKANAAGEEEYGQWAARAEFRNIAYWNHGSAPSRDDPLMRSFHWFSIADDVSAAFGLYIHVYISMTYNFECIV